MTRPSLSAAAAAVALLATPATAQTAPDEAAISAAFESADVNGDGAVNVDEYVGHVVRMMASVDDDDSDDLTPEEIPNVPEDRFRAVDRDGDGAISAGEGVAERMILFFELDGNRDGVLTLPEIMAHERAVAAR
jgi:Ca2+-binding EF-hand superfamily protein